MASPGPAVADGGLCGDENDPLAAPTRYTGYFGELTNTMTATLRSWTAPMKFTYAADAKPVDGFTIRRGIHRGGFGEVYYAVSDAGKEVALKLLTHDLDTELRGIRQCLNLKHPNLITLFDVRTDGDGDCWVVMEYVNGSNLEEVLTAFPQGLPLGEVRDWMQGIIAGVEYLHDRGLIHRDLKPANIYRENGVVKIGDVGLSKRFDGERRHQHTESIGTVYYMAPEITHGKYGPAVDIYSLGIILYELLTGKLPFNGETSGEILMKQLSASPDLSIVPANLRPVLAHALEKDPGKRTASVRQLWSEFENATSSPTAIPESHFVNGNRPAPPPPWETSRRDTDRTGDTGRKEANTPPRQPGLAYEAGKLWGAVVSAPPRADNRPAAKPKLHAQRNYWGSRFIIVLAVLALACIPWHVLPVRERLATITAIVLTSGFLSLLLYAREYWRPDHEPNWQPDILSRLSGRKPVTGSTVLPPLDWSGTFAVGAMAAVLFAFVGQLMTINISSRHDILHRPDMLVFFCAVTILGTWAVLCCRWLAEKWHWGVRNRRLFYAGAGLAVATLAAALNDYLMIVIGPAQRLGFQAAFNMIGVNPLQTGTHGEPAWLGYVVFFCGTFFLLGKRFDKMQAPTRPQRWMFRHVILASLVGFVWTQLFAFPQLLGLLWITSIAASVQLASPWQEARTSGTRN